MTRYSLASLEEAAPGQHATWVQRAIFLAIAAYSLVMVVDVATLGRIPYTAVSQTLALLVFLAALQVNRAGRTPLAAALVLAAVLGDIFVNVVGEGTVVGSWMMATPVVVAGAGLLLGTRAAWLLALFTSAAMVPAAYLGAALGAPDSPDRQDLIWVVILLATTAAMAAIAQMSLSTFGAVITTTLRQGRARVRIAQLGEIIENTLNEVYVFNTDTLRLRLVNRGARENLGFEGREFGSMKMSDVNPTFRHAGRAALDLLTVKGNEMSRVRGVHLRKDGSAYPVEMVLQVGAIGDEPVVIAFAEDISSREKAESDQRDLQLQLQHAQKMEAVGHLAGGVAHDFNNILTVIGGYAELLTTAELDEIPALTAEITEAQRRGLGLTRKLLAFARKEVRDPRPMSLSAMVGDLESMLARLTDGCDLTVESEGEGWIVGDLSQTEQMLLNLVANARDALPDGGSIKVRVEDSVVSPDDNAKAFACLSVSDTGPGIPPDVKERVFEPFFTTKPRGKGTGLGLSTVHGIINQHGGRVTIDSEPGQGCTVRLFFPEALPEARTAPDGSDPALVPDGVGERILIAEDEDSARALVSRILSRAGYRTVAVADASAALEALAREDADFGMLLTDVIMPGMNGIELAREVRVRWPDLRVLLMSGYVDDRFQAGSDLDPSQDLLLKPFTGEELRKRVARVLLAPR